MKQHWSCRWVGVRFVTALDLIKCLEQIKLQRLILTRAPISELPFFIRTMDSLQTVKTCKLLKLLDLMNDYVKGYEHFFYPTPSPKGFMG